MLTFLRAGGYSMWMVILFGAISLWSSIRFAFKADARKLAVIRAMTWATVFAIVAGVTSNLTAVAWHVNANPEWAHSPDVHLIVMQGIGEALTPAILGFTVLSLAWLLVAVGTRRLQDRGE